jgi:predicted amidohydrolase
MKVTLVQQEIIWGDRHHNLDAFERVAKAHYGTTDLLVFPEMFSTGFAVDKPELAENIDGDAIRMVKQWCAEGGYAIASSFMAGDGNKSYNRGFFCQPNGNIQFADKRHLFIGDEQRFFTPGDKHLDVEYKGIKFRVLICFDLRFPVWSRNVSGDDYDVLIYTANWPKDRIEAWDALTVARAMENQAYVIGVNAIGTDSYNVSHNGHSVLLDPRGKRIVEFDDFECAAKTGEIDIAYLRKVRDRLPFWKSADKFVLQK